MTRRALAAGLVALALAPTALASPATGEEVRALARAAAAGDAAALARLRSVDVVDGRPMPLGQALRSVDGGELDARLRALAGDGGGTATAVEDPAAEARQILDQRRFRGSSVPRPLHGALAWIGEKLAWPFRRLDGLVPGGSSVLWVVLAAIVVGVAAAFASRIAARRGGVRIERDAARRGLRADDPAALERHADEAERGGDLSLALRLRFRAGLLRLARARAIPPRASVRTGEVRHALRSRDFDELARAFDEVAYGGRAARADELDAAKTTWPRVVEAARPR